MASLFPDDTPPGARPGFRKFASPARPSRPKAVDADLPPLASGWILAHCDGGSRGNPGPAGYGAELVDHDGLLLAELSEFLGIKTNNFAEYSGMLAVLDWAITQGHRQLRVISDSELMVKQIQGKYKVNSPDLKPLFEEARRRIARLDGFQIHHALRHKNKTADRLANEAMDRGMSKPRSSNPEPPLRATPYPTAATTPPAPKSFGGVQETRGLEMRGQPSAPAQPIEATRTMLRGFVRDGVVHPLGGARLPEGSFVKILPE
ncbi:MAG: ribonuclease HI family protein [Janthinobacterium lividum]